MLRLSLIPFHCLIAGGEEAGILGRGWGWGKCGASALKPTPPVLRWELRSDLLSNCHPVGCEPDPPGLSRRF